MSEKTMIPHDVGNPYKIVDSSRERRKGIIASSLKQLMSTARERFCIPEDDNVTIVLEQDGTEIDDEDYFSTLEKNTSLMVLHGAQKWTLPQMSKSGSHIIVVDDTDNSSRFLNPVVNINETKSSKLQLGTLVSTLRNEPSQISLLGGLELEKLSDMDPESLADIVSDRIFLEQLKEASGRFLAEKRQAQDSMALLQMFASSAEMERT